MIFHHRIRGWQSIKCEFVYCISFSSTMSAVAKEKNGIFIVFMCWNILDCDAVIFHSPAVSNVWAGHFQVMFLFVHCCSQHIDIRKPNQFVRAPYFLDLDTHFLISMLILTTSSIMSNTQSYFQSMDFWSLSLIVIEDIVIVAIIQCNCMPVSTA